MHLFQITLKLYDMSYVLLSIFEKEKNPIFNLYTFWILIFFYIKEKICFNFTLLQISPMNLYILQILFKITFTYVMSYAFFKVFLKLKGVNPTFKKFLFFRDSYFVKQRGRNYFCLNYFQIYVFHLHTLSKGNQLFLKVFVWQNEI